MLATPAEAHAEWHANTGLQYGCPQDACWPPEPQPEPDTFDWIWAEDYRAGIAWDRAFEARCEATRDPNDLPF